VADGTPCKRFPEGSKKPSNILVRKLFQWSEIHQLPISFIWGLFDDAVSSSELNDMWVNEVETTWTEMVVPNLIYCLGIFCKGLSKTTKHISQDILCTGQDLNMGPSKYK
jgi:hypothetical protein